MLKAGAIISVSTFAAGITALVAFARYLPGATIQYCAQALVYGCIAIFGVFWTLHAARKKT
jgi:hypothetical protein